MVIYIYIYNIYNVHIYNIEIIPFKVCLPDSLYIVIRFDVFGTNANGSGRGSDTPFCVEFNLPHENPQKQQNKCKES